MTRRLLEGSVIYRFSPEAVPAWHVFPGEPLCVRCPDGLHGQIQTEDDLYHKVDPDRVNDAVGPIHIEGAEPGDTLVVTIEDIRVSSSQGYVLLIPGFGLLKDRITEPRTKICKVEAGAVYFGTLRIPLRPCIGTIGVSPESGEVSTLYPGDHGGNMDTTEVRAGARLYLPVFTRGALLAMGDGKAVMGDGEVCGTGVGVPLDIDLSCGLVKGAAPPRPVLETESRWMSVASAPTLDEASRLATLDMIRLLQRSQAYTFEDAYMLTSLVGDLKISQVVDPWMTVRMEVDKQHLASPLLPVP